jgi:hypothetical protein
MKELTEEDRARLQAQDIAVSRCPACNASGTFTPQGTVEYSCGSQLVFGERRRDRSFVQSEGCPGTL